MSSTKASYFFNYYSIGFRVDVYYFHDAVVVEWPSHSVGQCFDSFEFAIKGTIHQ